METNHTAPAQGNKLARTILDRSTCARLSIFKILRSQILIRGLLLLIVLFFSIETGWAEVSKKTFPKRIISLSPGITEILFEIGAGGNVVGITNFCTYPEATKNVAKVGGLINPSVETMITLLPDIIIYQAGNPRIAKFAQQLGIRSLPIHMHHIEEIFATIREIGEALGYSKSAEQLTKKLRLDIAAHKNRLAGIPAKPVLLLLSDSNDPLRDLYAVGRGTFLGELLEIAGGDNVLPDPKALYPTVSKEFIMRQSPEVIIEAGPKVGLPEADLEGRRKEWGKFPTIRAVREKNIHFIGADYILIPGPRLVNIIDQFAKAIHPDRFDPTAPIKVPVKAGN